jgi:hypothetical protein
MHPAGKGATVEPFSLLEWTKIKSLPTTRSSLAQGAARAIYQGVLMDQFLNLTLRGWDSNPMRILHTLLWSKILRAGANLHQ